MGITMLSCSLGSLPWFAGRRLPVIVGTEFGINIEDPIVEPVLAITTAPGGSTAEWSAVASGGATLTADVAGSYAMTITIGQVVETRVFVAFPSTLLDWPPLAYVDSGRTRARTHEHKTRILVALLADARCTDAAITELTTATHPVPWAGCNLTEFGA